MWAQGQWSTGPWQNTDWWGEAVNGGMVGQLCQHMGEAC